MVDIQLEAEFLAYCRDVNHTWAEVKVWVRGKFPWQPPSGIQSQMLPTCPHICQGIINELDTHMEWNFCVLSDLVPNTHRYAQPTLFGVKPMVVHKIAYIAANGRPPGDGLEVSHLCNNSLCIKPTHLFAESSLLNNRRKGCPVFVDCPHSHPDDKPMIIWICTHGGTWGTRYCIKNHEFARELIDDMEKLKDPANGWCCGVGTV
jgi:hypothetical protein